MKREGLMVTRNRVISVTYRVTMAELFSREEEIPILNLQIKTAIVLAAALCATPRIASAQTMQWTDKGYVTFNVGAQVGSHDLDTSNTFTLYEETATISSTQKVKSGAFFELGGAYRVWG